MNVGEVISSVGRRRFVAECRVSIGVKVQFEMTPEDVLVCITGHRRTDEPTIFEDRGGCGVALFATIATPEEKEAA